MWQDPSLPWRCHSTANTLLQHPTLLSTETSRHLCEWDCVGSTDGHNATATFSLTDSPATRYDSCLPTLLPPEFAAELPDSPRLC